MSRHKSDDTTSDDVAGKISVTIIFLLSIGWFLENKFFLWAGVVLLFLTISLTVIVIKVKQRRRSRLNRLKLKYEELFYKFTSRNHDARGDVRIGKLKYQSSDIEVFNEAFKTNTGERLSLNDTIEIFESMLSDINKERVMVNTFGNEARLLGTLSGTDFELLLTRLFTAEGYHVEHNGGAGDQGADLILTKDNMRIAVQAKRYTNSVSNTAIQEVVASLKVHDCQEAWVVSTSTYTPGAEENARANNVTLISGPELVIRLSKSLNEQWS